MKTILIVIAVLLVAIPAMSANYIENFESYSPGQLNANAGYLDADASWSVVAGSVINGTNAIVVPQNTPRELRGPLWGAATTFQDGTVASVNLRMDGEADWFWWNPSNDTITIGGYPYTPFAGIVWSNQGQSGAPAGLCYANGGYGWTQLPGYTMYGGDSYLVSATLDFTNQMVAYSVSDLTDGLRSFSFSAAFGKPTTTAGAAGGGFYYGGTGVSFDNLAINTVPEPGSLMMLASGVGALGLLRRRRN